MRLALSLVLFLFYASGEDKGTERLSGVSEGLFFSIIKVVVSDGVSDPKTSRITLHIPRVEGSTFGEVSARHKNALVKDGTIAVRGLQYPKSRTRPSKKYKRASFLVDFDEPVFGEVAKEVVQKFGQRPTMPQLTKYVHDFIDNKNMHRAFDIASKVAQTREGDCSEHAVLLVALARRFGFAARMVYGLVLVRAKNNIAAVGHAWAEYRAKREWQPMDAAVMSLEDKENQITVLGYIPVQVQQNEGPGYAFELLGAPNVTHIEKVTIDP